MQISVWAGTLYVITASGIVVMLSYSKDASVAATVAVAAIKHTFTILYDRFGVTWGCFLDSDKVE